MAIIHEATKEVICKVVYHGAGRCGKTTSLMYLDHHLPPMHKGKFVSLETPTERTLFFDLLPVLAEAGGYKFRYLLYATPGQEYYHASRKLVLKGADAVVFVVDCQKERMQDNWEALELLKKNLADLGQKLDNLPMVFQYNKRDLPNAMPIEDADRRYNERHLLSFPSVARTGQGVVNAFHAVAKMALARFWTAGVEAGMGDLFKTSVYLEDDAEYLKKQLTKLNEQAGAHGSLLVDEGTGIIAHSGEIPANDFESLGALLATNFTAAQELAGNLGGMGFAGIMQRGKHWLLRGARVDQRRFLVVACDSMINRRQLKDAITYFKGPLGAYLQNVDSMSPSRLPRFGDLFASAGQVALTGLEKG